MVAYNAYSGEKLFLNTLAFEYPKEPIPFYFAPADIEETMGLTRLKSRLLYPENIHELYPNLQDGDIIYTSFDEHHEGLSELLIDFSKPQNANLIKRYYNYLINSYFRQIKGLYVVTNNLTHDNQIWIRAQETPDYPNSVKFDRYTLKVDYDHFNHRPQLVLSYDRPTHISTLSIHKIENQTIQEDPLAILNTPDVESMISKVLYVRQSKKYIDKLQFLRSRFVDFDTSNAYPILSHALRAHLNYPIKENSVDNPLSRYFEKINKFFHDYLDCSGFRTFIDISKDGFSWANESQVHTTQFDSKSLLFGNGATDHKPQRGLNNGPYRPVPCNKINLFCVFCEKDIEYARFLMKSIKEGHNQYRNYNIITTINPTTGEEEHVNTKDVLKRFTGKDTVFAPAFISFKNERNPFPEVSAQLQKLFAEGKLMRGENYMALYVSPIGKRDRDMVARHAYYEIKEAMLKEKIEVQVILQTKIGTLQPNGQVLAINNFAYTLQNMALAICAKMGGMPWKFDVPKKNELVLGIGAFRNTELGATYIGSALSFDNTGSFNSFEYFLKDEMLELVGSIKDAIIRYSSINGTPDKLVIHYYKVMSYQKEFLPLENMLNSLKLNIPVYVITINKTESEDYVLFDAGNRPDYLPYSGRYINLGKGVFLLCNNSRYRQSKDLVNSFPFPVKLRISCPQRPNEALDTHIVKDLIEQVFQFSRIYFKSIHQQNLPVTLKYSELISEILPYFNDANTELLGNDNLWFL